MAMLVHRVPTTSAPAGTATGRAVMVTRARAARATARRISAGMAQGMGVRAAMGIHALVATATARRTRAVTVIRVRVAMATHALVATATARRIRVATVTRARVVTSAAGHVHRVPRRGRSVATSRADPRFPRPSRLAICPALHATS
ncbi:hypothetical protein [Microbacterium sp. Yaish 1]|uniref:hypothetical protein n=1 Tax=Microbacterium sp. Yaish 1 TaxID=2025014 RepID=UPI000B945C2E|nr:hypothetical protein [Microbacterium sp. Yaish 1]OYC96148.1 hypothetical protein CI089_16110 [Microbacterium sp. Yaish 1]